MTAVTGVQKLYASSLDVVARVAQGFIRSDELRHSWSEAVLVTFDPGVIRLDALVEIHLRTHSSMSNHKMRQKYRSATFPFNADQ